MKRMREYAAEGIRHFYFMMLQKDEVSYPPPKLASPWFSSRCFSDVPSHLT